MPFELSVSKFSPKILEKKRLTGTSPVILFVGSRGTGKSSCIADILSYFSRDMPWFVMSGTEGSNGFYKKYIHQSCIYNEFNKELVENILKKQKELAREYTKIGEDFKNHPERGIGILMDDLSFDNKILKHEIIKEIFQNGRHSMINLIISVQYAMDIAPAFRSNADFIFVGAVNKRDNIEKLYKYFFGQFDKLSDFKKTLDTCTENYGQLVLDNTSNSKKIEDCVFWYKAELNKSYKICEKRWPEWNRLLKNEDDEEVSIKPFKRPTGHTDISVKMVDKKRYNSDSDDSD